MDIVLSLYPTEHHLEALLGWLRGLEIDKEEKKHILMMWGDRVGVELTGDMVKRAGID